ncbi:MAG: HAD-IIIC family phosphatase [Thermomicrobiales bacterium]
MARSGWDGIELGEDGPGRAYQLFQQQLKRLKERGILLAVVSRNEEADVLEVFERHPGMVLRPADIATWSVNWRHKSENLRSLAEEMNLGLDSFVFLDDDPAVPGGSGSARAGGPRRPLAEPRDGIRRGARAALAIRWRPGDGCGRGADANDAGGRTTQARIDGSRQHRRVPRRAGPAGRDATAGGH